jgi:hypothetical protein
MNDGEARSTTSKVGIGKTSCVFGTSDKHGSVKSEPMRE